MYNKILEHLTTGCRALIAAVLLIAGIIWQAAAGRIPGSDGILPYGGGNALLRYGNLHKMSAGHDSICHRKHDRIDNGFPPRRIRHHRRNSIVYPLDCVSPRRLGGKYLSFKIWKMLGKRIGLGALAMIVNVLLISGRLPCTDFGVLEENLEKNVLGLSALTI